MAYKILDGCTSCGACEIECPNTAISAGPDIFVINVDKCTECVGFHGYPQCATVCPLDVCETDPAHPELEPDLLAKAIKMHPEKSFLAPVPSHFRLKE